MNPLKSVTLLKGKAQPVWAGHPWIFQKAVHVPNPSPRSGELVNILDAQQQKIGVGVYNETSLYRVRVLALARENLESFESILTHRIHAAVALRSRLGLPSSHTNAYRVINSEGDGVSGLTVDCYDDCWVVSSSAYWVEQQRALISRLLKAIPGVKHLIWRSQEKTLIQDGWTAQSDRATPPARSEASGMPQPDLAVIEPHPTVTVMENGIQYEVNFNLSQKTGLFFDQRVNREKLKALSQGRRVLDLYCYAGGFSLAAAQGGASYVLGIDSSAGAIQMAQRNAVLNGFTQVEFSEEDAVKAISKASDFDLIILDPPKLVPSRTHLPQAIRYYEGLHRQVFAAMKPGAMLLTCSCSSAITQALLIQIVRDTAAHLRKTVRILDCLGAGSDHPMLPAFPEGQYLQGLVVMLEN